MHIKYISWLPGILGLDCEDINAPSESCSLEDLMNILQERNGRYRTIFHHKNVIFAARDGQIIKPTDLIDHKDTITFFSPIAGG